MAALSPNRSSLKSLLDDLYQLLLAHYRCEYVYKNSVATSLFLNGHNPKDAYLTSEFRSAQSRADVVILNGTSTIYEIKTEYDSLENSRPSSSIIEKCSTVSASWCPHREYDQQLLRSMATQGSW